MKTTTISTECIVDLGIHMNVGESPVWNSRTTTWHWLDQAGVVFEYNTSEGRLSSEALGQKLGSLVLTDDNYVLVSGESSLLLLSNNTIKPVASVKHPYSPMKFADGRCDRQGRYMVSTMCPVINDRHEWGTWWNFSRENGFVPADTQRYIIPNGSAFNASGDIFYFSETDTQRRKIYKCKYDITEGIITDKSILINLKNEGLGRPDGAAVDTDGCLWTCCLDEGVILRITPEGRIDQKLHTPMKKPTMCSFGGTDYKTLLVTSLSRGIADLSDDPHGGQVLMLELPYQGIEEARLKGY